MAVVEAVEAVELVETVEVEVDGGGGGGGVVLNAEDEQYGCHDEYISAGCQTEDGSVIERSPSGYRAITGAGRGDGGADEPIRERECVRVWGGGDETH